MFIAEGKGGRQRIVPLSPWFFAALDDYLDRERPASVVTGKVFVVYVDHIVRDPAVAARYLSCRNELSNDPPPVTSARG